MILLSVLLLAMLSLLVFAHADSSFVTAQDNEKSVEVGKQVQIAADLRNGQPIEQSFAYIVQIPNGDGVTVSLSWLTGKLAPAQSLSPAISWIPSEAGTYDVTIFVWESVFNPTALSKTLSLTINVGPQA